MFQPLIQKQAPECPMNIGFALHFIEMFLFVGALDSSVIYLYMYSTVQFLNR